MGSRVVGRGICQNGRTVGTILSQSNTLVVISHPEVKLSICPENLTVNRKLSVNIPYSKDKPSAFIAWMRCG